MKIAYAKLGALDMHGEKDLGPPREVMNVRVAALLRPPRDSPRALSSNLFFERAARRSSVHVLGVWRFSDGSLEVGVSLDELRFTLVPCVENLCTRGTSKNPGVD